MWSVSWTAYPSRRQGPCNPRYYKHIDLISTSRTLTKKPPPPAPFQIMAPYLHSTCHRFLLLMLLTVSLDAAVAASVNLLPLLNATHNGPHEHHCNNLPSWTGGSPGSPAYESEDCDRAIRRFGRDVARNPGRAQWLSLGFPHAVPGYGAPVWTPKRYSSGKGPVFIRCLFFGSPSVKKDKRADGSIGGLGTCVLAIASLRDVGSIPSKPNIHGGETVGVIATWAAVSEYVQLLSEACQVRGSELGWTAYGR